MPPPADSGKQVVDDLCTLTGFSLTQILDNRRERKRAERVLCKRFFVCPTWRIHDANSEAVLDLAEVEAAIDYLKSLPKEERADPGLYSILLDILVNWHSELRGRVAEEKAIRASQVRQPHNRDVFAPSNMAAFDPDQSVGRTAVQLADEFGIARKKWRFTREANGDPLPDQDEPLEGQEGADEFFANLAANLSRHKANCCACGREIPPNEWRDLFVRVEQEDASSTPLFGLIDTEDTRVICSDCSSREPQIVLDNPAAKRVLGEPEWFAKLTPRECEVHKLSQAGMTHDEIAAKLGLPGRYSVTRILKVVRKKVGEQ